MIIYYLIIPLALLFVPWLIVRYAFKTKQTENLPYKKHAAYLLAAALVWWAAMLLPNIPVSGQTDTTTMHFLGGAVAALLFVYAVKSYRIRFVERWQPWISLFLFVSALGVLNELFEFFLSFTQFAVEGGDEWWDLAANTAGAYAAYIFIRAIDKYL